MNKYVVPIISLICTTCLGAGAAEPGASQSSSGNNNALVQGSGNGPWCLPGGAKAHGIKQALERSGVNLTDDQVEQMTTIRQNFFSSLSPRKDHACSLGTDLKEALTAQKMDDDQVRKIFAEIKTEIDDAYGKMVETVIAVAHVFTPEQRQKLKIAVDRASLGPLGTTPPTDSKTP